MLKKQGTKELAGIAKVIESHHALLAELAVDNSANGVKVVQTLRANIRELYEQNNQLIAALECDNWKNALLRARRLMGES